jgi:hypothetical protein
MFTVRKLAEVLSKLLPRWLQTNQQERLPMTVFSQEHLNRLWDEVKLINHTLAYCEQYKALLTREHGIAMMQAAVASLTAKKLELTLQAEALQRFLSE